MLNRHKLGLAVGSILGLYHLVWSILVALGIAQWLLDWVFKLHFIQPPYTVNAFILSYAIALVIITSVLGYVIGWVAGGIWNWLHATPKRGVAGWRERAV